MRKYFLKVPERLHLIPWLSRTRFRYNNSKDLSLVFQQGFSIPHTSSEFGVENSDAIREGDGNLVGSIPTLNFQELSV